MVISIFRISNAGPRKVRQKSSNFLQCIKDNFYAQMVDFKNHICGKTLDLIFTNNAENILYVEPMGNLADSDPSIILTELMFKSRLKCLHKIICDWKHGDVPGLADSLKNINRTEGL